ncbi:unnamed protein product [Absidia cylindrospora]
MNHHLVVSQQLFTNPSTTSPSPSVTPPSLNPPSPTIHLKNVSSWNVDTLKKLHLTLFPVHYSDSFYEQVQNVGEFAKVAYLDSIPVGAICCRIEPELQQEGKYRVYIMTLGVLEPYRRRRLGHLMLQHIVDQAQLQPTITRIIFMSKSSIPLLSLFTTVMASKKWLWQETITRIFTTKMLTLWSKTLPMVPLLPLRPIPMLDTSLFSFFLWACPFTLYRVFPLDIPFLANPPFF